MVANAKVQSLFQEIQNVTEFLGIELTDVNQHGIFGNTPLSVVIQWKDAEAVRLLLDAGANVNANLEDGQTPLHEAARVGDVAIVKLLVGQGANLSVRNKFDETPLDTARSRGHHEAVEVLLKTKR